MLSGMGSRSRGAVAVAVAACASSAGVGCGGTHARLSLEEFGARANAVCVQERRASQQAMHTKEYERSRARLRAAYGGLQPPPKRFEAAFAEFLRAFDKQTRAQLALRNNARALATLRDAGVTNDLRKMGKILSRDDRVASALVAEELADARVEAARLRLPLRCGEKIRRSIREARLHNSVAPMCAFYHPGVLAKALGVEATESKIAHALRELTGLPRVEAACLDGFAFQRRRG